MSARPHEHFYLDQIAENVYITICGTCDEPVGLIAAHDGKSFLPLAQAHWEEVYERG